MSVQLLKKSNFVTRSLPVNFEKEDELDFCSATSYNTAEVNLTAFKNVFISPDSVIYKNGLVYKPSLASDSFSRYYQFRHLAKKIVKGEKVTLDKNKQYLLVTDSYSSGHFHWFCEVLPRIICVKDKGKDFVLLLPNTPYVRNIGLASLAQLDIKFQDIVFMQDTAFYKACNLFFVSNVSMNGLNDELMKKVRSGFGINYPNKAKRIYVSRAKALYRKVLNEADFCDKLREYDFEVIKAEDLSFLEQAQFFSDASVFLSIHGAGLTNCIFMPSGGHVIELRRKENRPSNIGYWYLADALGHQYYYFNGTPDSDKPLVGQGCNLIIPINDFENKVLKYLFS